MHSPSLLFVRQQHRRPEAPQLRPTAHSNSLVLGLSAVPCPTPVEQHIETVHDAKSGQGNRYVIVWHLLLGGVCGKFHVLCVHKSK